MDPPEPLRTTVTLAIEVGSDPIAGSFAGVDGGRRDFHGWMELAAALEEIREGGAGAPSARRAPAPGSPGGS